MIDFLILIYQKVKFCLGNLTNTYYILHVFSTFTFIFFLIFIFFSVFQLDLLRTQVFYVFHNYLRVFFNDFLTYENINQQRTLAKKCIFRTKGPNLSLSHSASKISRILFIQTTFWSPV